MLGFKAFQLFNILLAIASAYVAYLIAKELKMKSPILAIAICCFTPVFIGNSFSGITEFLFGFIAIYTSYLFIKKHYALGAILLSFLPMVRIEGFLFLPIYAFFLANKKHKKEILYLLTGFIIYSITGALGGKKLFWILSEFGYANTSDVFGTGRIFQYLKRSPGFFGIANEIFFVTGLVAGISLYFRKKKEYIHEFTLVVLPFIMYLAIHTAAWYFGFGNSKGLPRYMVAIVPFMAVMATRGLVLFSLMFEIISKSETVRKLALGFAFISVIIIPFHTQTYPIEISNTDKTIKEASSWISNNSYSSTKIFYTSPYFNYFHELNPFDLTQGQNALDNCQNPENEIEPDELLVFDTFYGTVQGIKFVNLLNSPYFELLKIIEPENPSITFDQNYLVGIFRRTVKNADNIQKNIQKYSLLCEGFNPLITHDFNDPNPAQIQQTNIETERNSKNKYVRISRHNKYNLYDTLILPQNVQMPVVLQIELKKSDENPEEMLRYMVETYQNGVQIAKKTFLIDTPQPHKKNEWHKVELRVQLPEITNTSGITIVTYLWNKHKEGFLIDDYSISTRYELL